MKHIQTWLAVIIFLMCAPAFADNTNDPFQEVAAKYLAANPKPGLPEEARKFKVQAEFAVQEKQFDKAVELYGKALDIAPWWPEGHFNRALILGETKKYWDAMREMKRYLLLAPDAANARAAQDKVYQWEGVAGPLGESHSESIERLGLMVSELTAEKKKDLHIDHGLLVEDFKGSAARAAGFQQGDVLLSIGNVPIRSLAQLNERLKQVPNRRTVALLVRRVDNESYVAITLDEK